METKLGSPQSFFLNPQLREAEMGIPSTTVPLSSLNFLLHTPETGSSLPAGPPSTLVTLDCG